MRLNIIGLVSIVVILLVGVGGFAYWSKSQSKLPEVYYVEFAEETASKSGVSFQLPSSIETSLIKNDYTALSKSDFETKLISEKYGENHILDVEEVFAELPTETQALYALRVDGPTVDEIIEWSIKNNIEELYLFYSYKDPNLTFVNQGGLFDSIENFYPSNLFDNIFSIPEAHANTIPSPSCNTGGLQLLEGYTGYINQSDGCGGTSTISVTIWYDAYWCHWALIADHAWRNIYNVTNQPFLGMINCMNDSNHNNQTYMCGPQNLQVGLFKGTSHSEYDCNTSSSVYGCGSVGSGSVGTPPLTSVDQMIDMREGKFRSNMWLVRHEAQHNYGYTHGGVGNCSSFGNSKYEKHCCNSHKDH